MRPAEQSQQPGRVRLVRRLLARESRLQIIVEIRQAEVRLADVDRVVRRILEVDIDTEREHAVEVARVRASHQARERGVAAGAADGAELLLDGLHAELLDPVLGHEGAVVRADLALQARWFTTRVLGGFLEQAPQSLVDPVGHYDAQRVDGLVGGNLVAVEPAAVRVAEKIRTRPGRRVATS